MAAEPTHLSDIGAGYAAYNYAYNSLLQNASGGYAPGVRSGVNGHLAYFWPGADDSVYWGGNFRLMQDLSSPSAINVYALNLELRRYLAGAGSRAEGIGVSFQVGIAVNVLSNLYPQTVPGGTSPAQSVSTGNSTIGADVLIGAHYALKFSDNFRMALGPQLTLLMLPGGAVPSLVIEVSSLTFW